MTETLNETRPAAATPSARHAQAHRAELSRPAPLWQADDFLTDELHTSAIEAAGHAVHDMLLSLPNTDRMAQVQACVNEMINDIVFEPAHRG